MDTTEIQNKLNQNGFPCGNADGAIGPRTKEAVAHFQTAYCGPGGWLDVDGVAGPKTQTALEFLPRLSTHFSASEVACRHCGKAYVHRELLSALEVLRNKTGPISLLDAYRCSDHNRGVGGAANSMHLYGAATDLATEISINTAVGVRKFSGVGNRGNLASHVDVRHLMGSANETPNASPQAPARWSYPG